MRFYFYLFQHFLIQYTQKFWDSMSLYQERLVHHIQSNQILRYCILPSSALSSLYGIFLIGRSEKVFPIITGI